MPGHTVVHLHVGVTPPDSAGFRTDMFHPGASREHGYGATQWYHDHALDTSGRNFHMGLLGFYVLEDGTEDELPLPRDEQHVQLVVTNRLFGSVG